MKLKVSNHLRAGVEHEKVRIEAEMKQEDLRHFSMNSLGWQKRTGPSLVEAMRLWTGYLGLKSRQVIHVDWMFMLASFLSKPGIPSPTSLERTSSAGQSRRHKEGRWCIRVQFNI